jgi:hypothetical protein
MSTRSLRTTVRFCLLPLLVLVFVMSSSSSAQASIIPNPCALLPSPANLICGGGMPGINILPGVPNPVSTVIDKAAGEAANAIVEPVIHEVTKLFASAMTAMLKTIFEVVSNSTEPELTAPWFVNMFELLAGLALVIGGGFLIPTIYEGVKEGDLDYVGESVAIFGGFIALLLLLVGAVAGVLWVVDGQIVPYMTNQALGDLQTTMANHKVDFTKDQTLALIAWVMLRFIMAIVLIIAIRTVEAPNKSAILTGAFALGAMPFITWAFVKAMANHRVSALGAAFNARAMWDALPFT